MGTIMREMSRVLKEDGKFYIVDYMRGNGLMKKIIFNIYLKIFEPRHIQVFLDNPWPQVLNSVGFHGERTGRSGISYPMMPFIRNSKGN